MSKILHCCTASLFSIVAALSPPPIASRFRDIIFRRRSPFVVSDFESLPQLYFPSSQPFVTSSVVAIFHRLRPQIASATLSSVDAAFRRLFPSTQPFVDSSLPRHHIPSSQPFVDSSRLLPPSQPFTASGRKSLSRLYHPSSQPFVDCFRRRSLSSTPRFHDLIFRRHSLSSTPSVVAALRRLRLRVASATLASVAALRAPCLRGGARTDGRTVGRFLQV